MSLHIRTRHKPYQARLEEEDRLISKAARHGYIAIKAGKNAWELHPSRRGAISRTFPSFHAARSWVDLYLKK